LEWKIVYVGSAEDEKYDQTLDSVLVGPVQLGVNKFVFQAEAPNPDLIPPQNILDVTVVLLLGLYKDQEFIRVGYYVNNEIRT
jgi:histone chaperone ASF1